MSWRADRSDAHLSPEEEAAREAEARDYFDGIAPKRHSKPSRSDYSSVYADALPPSRRDDDYSIPEHRTFQTLEANSAQKLVCEGSEVVEEYVQTEYYDDLNCVDKQHHTTGTGFIEMEKSDGSSFQITSDTDASDAHLSCRGNPATNEWIPSADTVVPTSHKPNRSDV